MDIDFTDSRVRSDDERYAWKRDEFRLFYSIVCIHSIRHPDVLHASKFQAVLENTLDYRHVREKRRQEIDATEIPSRRRLLHHSRPNKRKFQKPF
jgi:hypothetical protein